MNASEHLKQAYTRALIFDQESGTVTAYVVEFHGCIAQGNSLAEASERLEVAAESWIEAALEMGQAIPPPSGEYVTYCEKCERLGDVRSGCETDIRFDEREKVREWVRAARAAGVANSPGPLYCCGFVAALDHVLKWLDSSLTVSAEERGEKTA